MQLKDRVKGSLKILWRSILAR